MGTIVVIQRNQVIIYLSNAFINPSYNLVQPPGTPVHKVPIETRPSYTSELKLSKTPQVSNLVEVKSKTWCFHCASPWNLINSDMQQAMRNLLDIRRARFPATSFVRADCSHPKVSSSFGVFLTH
jgi:hypothetical protein